MSHPFQDHADIVEVARLCNELKKGRGKDCGGNILDELPSGRLKDPIFAQLCRWVRPRKPERRA